MKMQVSVVMRRDMRTHGADASSLSLDWWVGGSDIEGLDSPIKRLISLLKLFLHALRLAVNRQWS